MLNSRFYILVLATLLLTSCTSNEPDKSEMAQNHYQVISGDDFEEYRSRWDAIYNTDHFVFGKEPSELVRDHLGLLPKGRVLDIGMGEGQNSVFLAKKGFILEGVDISEIALRKAKLLAKQNGVSIQTFAQSIESFNFKPDAYEVILNLRLLRRALIPAMRKSLKKNGVIVFESSTINQIRKSKDRTLRKDTLLNIGEAKELFRDFEILFYQEVENETDSYVRLIAKKTANPTR